MEDRFARMMDDGTSPLFLPSGAFKNLSRDFQIFNSSDSIVFLSSIVHLLSSLVGPKEEGRPLRYDDG
jgi:lipoprotein signal peptidase